MRLAQSPLIASVLALGSLMVANGCATNDSSLFLVGVLDISSTTCVGKPDPSAALLAGGVLDDAFKKNYAAIVLVGNQLVRRGSHDQLRTETARVDLLGAEVRLESIDARTVYDTYSTNGTGFIDPASGETPGYASMLVNVLPDVELAKLPAFRPLQIVAKIRVFGNSLGGQSITSSELSFPIGICTGCLIDYFADATNPDLCAAPSAVTGTTAADICDFGQDQRVPCTLCSTTIALCRDIPKLPAPP
jgi:hypothetical protein